MRKTTALLGMSALEGLEAWSQQDQCAKANDAITRIDFIFEGR
jgi:hypothetical protein